jgi:hypothetical protein
MAAQSDYWGHITTINTKVITIILRAKKMLLFLRMTL